MNHENHTSALVVMARQLSVDPHKLLTTLKETVFKGATESELLTLVVLSNTYQLNPLLKEIYAFPSKGGGIVPVVSVDGWICMVNRQPQLDGLEFSFENDADGKVISCTCVIYVKGRAHPVKVTEFFSECFRATDPWKQMPRRMLRHKALKEAARVAFGFSGVSDEDEARDISRQFPPRRHISVEKPDFAADAKPADAQPITESQSDSQVSAKERLAGQLNAWKMDTAQCLTDLKLMKFPGVESDVSSFWELPEEVCEAILERPWEDFVQECQDARWLESMKAKS